MTSAGLQGTDIYPGHYLKRGKCMAQAVWSEMLQFMLMYEFFKPKVNCIWVYGLAVILDK